MRAVSSTTIVTRYPAHKYCSGFVRRPTTIGRHIKPSASAGARYRRLTTNQKGRCFSVRICGETTYATKLTRPTKPTHQYARRVERAAMIPTRPATMNARISHHIGLNAMRRPGMKYVCHASRSPRYLTTASCPGDGA